MATLVTVCATVAYPGNALCPTFGYPGKNVFGSAYSMLFAVCPTSRNRHSGFSRFLCQQRRISVANLTLYSLVRVATCGPMQLLVAPVKPDKRNLTAGLRCAHRGRVGGCPLWTNRCCHPATLQSIPGKSASGGQRPTLYRQRLLRSVCRYPEVQIRARMSLSNWGGDRKLTARQPG